MKIIRAVLITILPAIAHADDYVSVNLASHHWNRNDVSQFDLNELNPGIGLERSDGDVTKFLGVYRNSIRNVSGYALAGYEPIHAGNFGAGIVGGIVTGYQNVIDPAAGLIISYKGSEYGMNMIAFPTIKSINIFGAVGIQLLKKIN